MRQYIPALVHGVRMLKSTPHIIISAFGLRLRGTRASRSEMLRKGLGRQHPEEMPRKGLGGQHPEQYSGPRHFHFGFCACLRSDVPAHMESSFSTVGNAQERSWEATIGAIFRPEVFTVWLLAPTSGLMFPTHGTEISSGLSFGCKIFLLLHTASHSRNVIRG